MDTPIVDTPAEVTEKRVPFGKRIILVAISPDTINVATFGLEKGLNPQEEIQQRVADIDLDTKFITLICPKATKAPQIIGKAYKAIAGKGIPPQKQYVFPEKTSLSFLLLLLDMQLRGLNIKELKLSTPPSASKLQYKRLEERITFQTYYTPEFHLHAGITLTAPPKKAEKLDLSAVTGKSFSGPRKRKVYVPKKRREAAVSSEESSE